MTCKEYLSVYVAKLLRYYLSSNEDWLSNYVRYEMAKVYAFYKAKYFKGYWNKYNIHLTCNVPNVEENVGIKLSSVQSADILAWVSAWNNCQA